MGNGRSIPLETPYRSPRMSPRKIHVPMSETFRIFAPSNHPRPMPQTAHKTSPPNHPRSQRVGSGILYLSPPGDLVSSMRFYQSDVARTPLDPAYISSSDPRSHLSVLASENRVRYEGFSFPDKRAVLESIVFYSE